MGDDKENNVFSASQSGSGSGSGQRPPSRNQIFGKKLKERRKLFGFSQPELAKKIGGDKGTIQNYESGSLPKGDYAILLAEVLECSLDWLLMDKGPEPGPPDKEKQVGETEPLYNKVETPGVGDRMVEYNAGVDAFGKAVAGLKEIFDSRDPVLIPAIQANIHAFQISVRREHHIQEQTNKISALEKENSNIKARLAAIEKRLPPTNENIEKKVM